VSRGRGRMRAAEGAALPAALRDKRILVVGGAGGVGKTTVAASLALRAALLGRRVLVCTIDPSRRLATSLGLNRLPDRPRALSLARLGPRPGGALWAMTLDTKRTFDALVERHMASAETRRRVLENRFYKQVSSALAGSHEYMAMEKLLELSADPRFDLVVLDTPPTRHALDFLEAPERLMGFLDTSVLRYFLKPYFVAGRLTLRVATRTGALALSLADRFLGLQFLQDLSEFFLAFEGMYDGFKARAAQVHDLLRGPAAGFVVVAAPARPAMDEALYFHRRLRESGMPFVAFVVNRVHPDPAATSRAGSDERPPALDPDLAEGLLAIFRDQQRVARRERRALARLAGETGEPVVVVPELDADVHDLRGLKEVGEPLLQEPRPRTSRRARRAAAPAASGRKA
jgi:anion-transporting  ArsA/GET3 family ATPase